MKYIIFCCTIIYYIASTMKFSISLKKLGSIVLLLLVVFISLALSDIPYIASFRQSTKQQEGLADSIMTKIKTILDGEDTYLDKVDKVRGILKDVENKEDEMYVKFMDIINKTNYAASDKVTDMKSIYQ